MKIIYRIYQLCVVLPIGLLATLLTAIVTIAGCALGGSRFWGYYPGKWWSWLLVRLFLLPVKVEGREHLDPNQSYVFCPNHQGAFDIFLIYGFLGRNFKWMLKQSLRRMPVVGKACESARFVFVDKGSPSQIKKTMDEARGILSKGMSLVVFPEGRRTETGRMDKYKRGAFMLADELQLPVVPITINGSFDVMPRQKDGHFVNWHPLSLTVHKPIFPETKGPKNIIKMSQESYEATYSAIEEKYK